MKLSDAQKAALKKHMDGHKGTPSEKKSHRLKMIGRMARGMSLQQAHKDIMSGDKGGKSYGGEFAKKNKGKAPSKMSNPIDGDLLIDAAEAAYGGDHGSGIAHSSFPSRAAAEQHVNNTGRGGLVFRAMVPNRFYTVIPPENLRISKSAIYREAARLDGAGRFHRNPREDPNNRGGRMQPPQGGGRLRRMDARARGGRQE